MHQIKSLHTFLLLCSLLISTSNQANPCLVLHIFFPTSSSPFFYPSPLQPPNFLRPTPNLLYSRYLKHLNLPQHPHSEYPKDIRVSISLFAFYYSLVMSMLALLNLFQKLLDEFSKQRDNFEKMTKLSYEFSSQMLTMASNPMQLAARYQSDQMLAKVIFVIFHICKLSLVLCWFVVIVQNCLISLYFCTFFSTLIFHLFICFHCSFKFVFHLQSRRELMF